MANPKTTTKTPRPVRSDSEKADNFKAAAPARVDRVLKALRSLSTLSRPVRYKWTADQHAKIWNAIQQAAESCEAQFRNPTGKGVSGFTL